MTLSHNLTFALAMILLSEAPSPAQQSQPRLQQQLVDQQLLTTDSIRPAGKVVVVTGARFSYQLMEKWIDAYNKINPGVQIIIESRGSTDPLKFDVLAEVYSHKEEIKKNRHYVTVGRYAILPVATSNSPFANLYSEKGLNKDRIVSIFFNDIFNSQEKKKSIEANFNPYTRLQKAGAPSVFADHFGYEQKDLKGTTIAGADIHLLKALLRDSIGVTYLPLPLVYDLETRQPIKGLTVLPVDLNGNGKVNEEEKFYDNLDNVIDKLESTEPSDVKNIPIADLHLSVDRATATPEAIDFLKWVQENGQAYLRDSGYLKPERKEREKENLEELASKQGAY
jgi:ABC-type phosphate transport system substrate-binding protein